MPQQQFKLSAELSQFPMELTHSCHVTAKYSPVIGNSLGDVLQLSGTIPLISGFRKDDCHAGAKFKGT